MTPTSYDGKYFIVMIEDPDNAGQYFPIAGAKNHSGSITRNIREVSSKSSGDSVNREYGRLSASGSVDGLVSFDTGIANLSLLREQIIEGNKIKVLEVLLDYETAGKAPLADATSIVVRDATGDDDIDSATTTIETTNDNFAMTSVFSGQTPKAFFYTAVLENVDDASADGEDPTFSFGYSSDGDLQQFSIAAFA